MIYTSYFSKAKKLGDNYIKVGISRFPPKNITNREFILRYKDEVMWHLDEFIRALKPFDNDKGSHIVLCCYERLGLCHRHVLAELLRQRGINIKEYKEG